MDTEPIRSLYEAIISGWNARDGRAMAEPFAEDGVVVGYDGASRSRCGRE